MRGGFPNPGPSTSRLRVPAVVGKPGAGTPGYVRSMHSPHRDNTLHSTNTVQRNDSVLSPLGYFATGSVFYVLPGRQRLRLNGTWGDVAYCEEGIE